MTNVMPNNDINSFLSHDVEPAIERIWVPRLQYAVPRHGMWGLPRRNP